MVKHRGIRLLFLLLSYVLFSEQIQAKKMSYRIEVYEIVYNGDTLNTGGPIILEGIIKKHTRRLPIATLNTGESLHLELWLTVEGTMKQRFTTVQNKYYTRDEDAWRLVAVAPRIGFKGRHYDRGHYLYHDPLTEETLEVKYKLEADFYQKASKRKK